MSLYDRAAPNPAGHRDVSPAQVAAGLEGARLVDVRETPELSSDLGHIGGVEHVPLATVEAAAAKWDRGADLVLVCRSGGRSGRAAAALSALGFTRVMNMVGGMIAWNEAKLPIQR